MSSICALDSLPVIVCPGRRVPISVATAFHGVHGGSVVLVEGQEGGSLVPDCHHIAASWEGNMLTSHELVEVPAVSYTHLTLPTTPYV